MQNINERITLLRESKSLKQNKFADLVGIAKSSLSEIETGKRCPSVDLIAGISANCSEINIDWVLTGEGEMYKPNHGVNEASPGYGSCLNTQKVVELFNDLNETQQREIFFALEEKKQINDMKEQLDSLVKKVFEITRNKSA